MMHEGLESNSVVKNIKYRCYPCLRHEKNIRVLSSKTKSQKVMKYKRVFIHFGDVQLVRKGNREHLPVKRALWEYWCI